MRQRERSAGRSCSTTKRGPALDRAQAGRTSRGATSPRLDRAMTSSSCACSIPEARPAPERDEFWKRRYPTRSAYWYFGWSPSGPFLTELESRSWLSAAHRHGATGRWRSRSSAGTALSAARCRSASRAWRARACGAWCRSRKPAVPLLRILPPDLRLRARLWALGRNGACTGSRPSRARSGDLLPARAIHAGLGARPRLALVLVGCTGPAEPLVHRAVPRDLHDRAVPLLKVARGLWVVPPSWTCCPARALLVGVQRERRPGRSGAAPRPPGRGAGGLDRARVAPERLRQGGVDEVVIAAVVPRDLVRPLPESVRRGGRAGAARRVDSLPTWACGRPVAEMIGRTLCLSYQRLRAGPPALLVKAVADRPRWPRWPCSAAAGAGAGRAPGEA